MGHRPLTTIVTGEGQAAVFVAVDHCSTSASTPRGGDPLRSAGAGAPGVRRRFGAIGKDVAKGLALRHDHGSQYMADVFQTEIAFLGIERSPAFVRAPEGRKTMAAPDASSPP